jgi:hypothetical protein
VHFDHGARNAFGGALFGAGPRAVGAQVAVRRQWVVAVAAKAARVRRLSGEDVVKQQEQAL